MLSIAAILMPMRKELTPRHTMGACYLAFVSQAIINNLAPLLFVVFQDAYDISLAEIGRLIMINFGTQLVVDGLSVKFADRIGYRRLMVAAHVFCSAGLVLLSVLPNALASPYAGLVIAVVTYAVGGGLIEVLASPIADALPGEAKAASMSLLHAFYCWGHVMVVVVTTALLAVIGSGAWYVLPVLWAVVPAVNVLNFARVPLMPAVAEQERLPLKKLLTSKLFILAILLMICSGASEQAMSQWASLFAERGLGVSKVMGDLLGPCLFAICMGVGRTLFGVLGERIRLSWALVGCAVLCVACYLVAALAKNPLLALLGCAVTGFAVSLMWPGVLSLSARTFPMGGTAVFSLLALGGDIGCAVGPWLTGAVSDVAQSGLRGGLLAAVLFPLGLAAGVLLFVRPLRRAAKERA